MSVQRPKALLAWSSGKDCAWTLHCVRQRGDVEVAGLLTTFNEAVGRVAMHGVRRELVQAQARAAELPLWEVALPWPCSNEEYERRMHAVTARAKAAGITVMLFGDLFLEDIRAYRESRLKDSGVEPRFPLWGTRGDTPRLAREMMNGGLEATLACIDTRRLGADFAGRAFDAALLRELPPEVDPCGENGEFHTFCSAGPMFSAPVPVVTGERIERDGYLFTDLVPDPQRSAL